MMVIFFIMVSVWAGNQKCFADTITDYSSLPLFMSTSLLPNIMLIVDNSGSMFNFAYATPTTYDFDTNSNSSPLQDFDPTKTYYGYFDSLSWYTYSGTGSAGKFSVSSTKSSINPGSNPTSAWDGNFLNWLTTRRVDVIRKALTGGATDSTGLVLLGQAPDTGNRGYYKNVSTPSLYTPYSSLYKSIYCDTSAQINIYTSSSTHYTFNIKVYVAAAPAGILQAVGSNARWGLTNYNNPSQSNAGGIVVYPCATRTMATLTSTIINAINTKVPDSNTPLAETLWTVTGYFAQKTSMSISSIGPRYHSGDYTVSTAAGIDPYNYSTTSTPLYAPCAKSFVLLITDGEPCADGNLSNGLLNYAKNSGSQYYCTSSTDCGLPGCDAGGNVPGLESVALYAHTNDLRSDLTGTQTLDIYTVFAFGSGSTLLRDTAINGGFIDKNGNNLPDPIAASPPLNEWAENNGVDPDNYYEASDGAAIASSLLEAIDQMLNKTASGTSVGVLATSATGEGTLFQAYFEPSVIEGTRTVNWLGHLQALWVDAMGNLREDTNNDAALVYTQDKIIKYVLDPDTGAPMIQKYSDSNGDGVPDSTTPDETMSLDAGTPIWDAGKLLAKRSAASRTIYTFKDSNGNGIPVAGEFIPFTASNWSGLRPFLRVTNDSNAQTNTQNIINFIRGVQVTGYRDRQLTVDGVPNQVWKLGDIVYSTPAVSGKPTGNYQITYGDASYADYYSAYQNRDTIVCAGANDGMLHAFWAGRYHSGDNTATGNASTPQVEAGWFEKTRADLNFGDEAWAYIPCNLLPQLHWLTDSTYGNSATNTHVYYVDLKPRIADVKIFTPDSVHINGWGTVLIGGMRLGGSPTNTTATGATGLTITDNFGSGTTTRTFRSAYFALDITDPANPNLLWEYTDANLGYTSSYPTVIKVGTKWYAVFGSGPTNIARGDCDNATGTATGAGVNGKIYIVDIATGTASRIFTTPENRAFLTDPIGIDTQLDYSVDLVYIGETYDAGTTYGGKMYRMWTKDNSGVVQQDPNSWVNPSVLFDTTATGMSQPLTSSATAAFDDQHNLWVYFGTGKFMGTIDKTDTYQQTFYAIKEPCSVPTCTTTVANNTTSLFNATNVGITQTSGTVAVSGVTGVTTWNQLLSNVGSYPGGWYYNLSTSTGNPSERVIYRPVAYGGVVLFTTFTPNNDICGYGGNSSLYALNYTTGTANNAPVIGTSGTTILKSENLGSGMASGVALHVVAAETGGASNNVEKAYIQMSTGVIVQADVTTSLQKSGTTSWRETK